jgi:hypothetical protein
MASIDRKHLRAFPQALDVLLFHTQVSSDFEQLALLVYSAGKAITMMIGDDKLHSNTA